MGLANIKVKKNAVQSDPCSPFVTGGLRLGPPKNTKRVFGKEKTVVLTVLISDVLNTQNDENKITAEIYDFVDDVKYLKQHSRVRLRIYYENFNNVKMVEV